MNKLCPVCIVFLLRNSRNLIFTAVQILVSPHCISDTKSIVVTNLLAMQHMKSVYSLQVLHKQQSVTIYIYIYKYNIKSLKNPIWKATDVNFSINIKWSTQMVIRPIKTQHSRKPTAGATKEVYYNNKNNRLFHIKHKIYIKKMFFIISFNAYILAYLLAA